MVLDTSAVLAILLDEPERATFVDLIEGADLRLMSAASYLEAAIVIDYRIGYEGDRDLRFFLIEADIQIVPVTVDQVDVARATYRKFGRGYHPAGLNYGDCMAYALASTMRQPLLFKGNEFSRTDVARVAGS